MTSVEPPLRWTFRDPALLWLFPVTYGIHLAEEWLGGAPILLWLSRADRPLAAGAFVAAHTVGLSLMVVGILLVRRGARYHWIVPALATAVLLNTAGHLAGAIAAGGYSAGLVTGVVLWLPLGLLTLLRVRDQASARTWRAGLAAGLLIELIVLQALRTVGS